MLSLLLIMSTAAPVQFEDLALLDKNIQIQANAEPVDKRLKLAKCPDAPVIIPAIDGGAVVRCLGLGWRLHVAARAPNAMDAGADIVIRKGDVIECITNGPGFAVSAQMIALDDARIGQSLRVKSLTSATPMTAMAKARGLAIF